MTGVICPYCRGAIDSATEAFTSCEGCGTEHHADCYAENGGCTVFGCRCAPAEEPKVSIATPDLAQAPSPASVRPSAAPPPPPPPPIPGAIVAAAAPSPELVQERSVEELGASVVPSMFGSYYSDSVPEAGAGHEPKSRTGFILLGALLGAFGAHSFYAGYKAKGWTQLAITVVTLGFAGPMTWIWAIIDICTIDRDNYGITFTS